MANGNGLADMVWTERWSRHAFAGGPSIAPGSDVAAKLRVTLSVMRRAPRCHDVCGNEATEPLPAGVCVR